MPLRNRGAVTQAKRIARAVGMPLSNRPRGMAWNGRSLCVRKLDASDILHEVGHWLVATPKQRQLPEYGCGSGNDTLSAYWDEVNAARDKDSGEAENRASLLGIAFECLLGWDWTETFHNHNWELFDWWPRDFPETHWYQGEGVWLTAIALSRSGHLALARAVADKELRR